MVVEPRSPRRVRRSTDLRDSRRLSTAPARDRLPLRVPLGRLALEIEPEYAGALTHRANFTAWVGAVRVAWTSRDLLPAGTDLRRARGFRADAMEGG